MGRNWEALVDLVLSLLPSAMMSAVTPATPGCVYEAAWPGGEQLAHLSLHPLTQTGHRSGRNLF